MRGTILIADNDALSLQKTARALVEQGWVVETAHNGLAASCALTRRTYDCVAINLRLPLLNGFEVLRRVRATAPATTRIAISPSPETRLGAADPGLAHAALSPHQLMQLRVPAGQTVAA